MNDARRRWRPLADGPDSRGCPHPLRIARQGASRAAAQLASGRVRLQPDFDQRAALGVLPKLGTYGLIAVAIPLLPQGVEPFLPYVAAFGVINIIYGAFVAFLQPDLKALVAYSSIGTLGFILLGAASGNAVGLNGAVFQQVSHGLYSALLFILVGVIAARTGPAASRTSAGWPGCRGPEGSWPSVPSPRWGCLGWPSSSPSS